MRSLLFHLFPGPALAIECRPAALRDDSVVVEMIRTGSLFGDLSLERWLDRVERREERA